MNYILSILFLISFGTAAAQSVTEKHYVSGELAVRQTVQEAYRNYGSSIKEEKVEVFNKKGEVVFVGSRRNFAGHSSVSLTFHENGGVKTIKASSAPDAGIQWYKSEYVLDEDGNVVSKWEDSHDKRHTLIEPSKPMQPTFPEKLTVEELKKVNPTHQLKATKVILHNRTNKPLEVLIRTKIGVSETTIETIKKRGEAQIFIYPTTAQASEPKDRFTLEVRIGRSKKFKFVDIANLPAKKEVDKEGNTVWRVYFGI